MDFFNLIGANNPQMNALIKEIRDKSSSVTPTLHVFAQRLHLTYFTSKSIADFDNSEHYSKKQLKKALHGYSILSSYVKEMFDMGIQLNMGTDCQDPGKAALSELLLLYGAGISMQDVLCIGTINGAKAIGKDDCYGSIEKGKRANLIIFSKNPLDKPQNLLEEKTVIKDGQIWKE
jgi:imidazolonepropionase-like amidohydrolase